jgi:hypothetical protein
MDVTALDNWLTAVSLELDLTDRVRSDVVLDLARDVAHEVERPAAPLTAYLVGVAVGRGGDPERTAERIRELAQGWDADRIRPTALED